MTKIIKDIEFIEELLEKSDHGEIRKDGFARIIAHYGDFSLKDARFIMELIIELLETIVLYKFKLKIRGLFEIFFVPTKGGRLVTPPNGKGKAGIAQDGEKIFLVLADNIKYKSKERM